MPNGGDKPHFVEAKTQAATPFVLAEFRTWLNAHGAHDLPLPVAVYPSRRPILWLQRLDWNEWIDWEIACKHHGTPRPSGIRRDYLITLTKRASEERSHLSVIEAHGQSYDAAHRNVREAYEELLTLWNGHCAMPHRRRSK